VNAFGLEPVKMIHGMHELASHYAANGCLDKGGRVRGMGVSLLNGILQGMPAF
jgi:hypothetical protein